METPLMVTSSGLGLGASGLTSYEGVINANESRREAHESKGKYRGPILIGFRDAGTPCRLSWGIKGE